MPKFFTYLIESGVVVASARGAWFAWMQWIAYRDSRAATLAVAGRGEIREALRELRYNTPANYVHVIRIHNGGGDLKATLPLYMSCLFEECDVAVVPAKPSIQGLELDDNYREMIMKLLEVRDGAAKVDTIDNDTLQDIYSLQEATYTRSVLLRANRDGIYFLRTTSRTEPLDGKENNIQYRKAVSALRKFY